MMVRREMTRRKQPDDTLHGMTRGFDIIKALFEAARRQGLNPEEFLKSMHATTGMADVMVEAAIAKLRPQTPAPKPVERKTLNLKVYQTVVDCTVAEEPVARYRKMRDATGCKVWSPADQDEKWGITETGIYNRGLMLAHPGYDTTEEQVDSYLREHGLVDASSADLLSFGAAPETRDLQLEYPVVARDSVAEIARNRFVLSLSAPHGVRVLRAFYLDRGWHDGCRFLVRKAPPLVTPTP